MKKKTLKKVKKFVGRTALVCGLGLALYGGYTLKMENAELKANAIAESYDRALEMDKNTVGHNVTVVRKLNGYDIKIENNRGDKTTGEWDETRFKTINVQALGAN